MADLTRAAVINLFTALGITTAAKWNAKRMAAKLAKVDEMVDDDTDIEDEEVQATLTAVLEAIENEEEITIIPEGKDAKPAAKNKKAPVTKQAAKNKKAPAKNKKPVDQGEDKEPVTKEPKAPKAPAKPKTPGVRETRTRPFLAGIIIKKYGLAAGVTDAMVAELDDEYGKVNPIESLFTLRNAWHALRGFQTDDK